LSQVPRLRWDLVGHVLAQEPWEVLSFPAVAEAGEVHRIETIWGPRCFRRHQGGLQRRRRGELFRLGLISTAIELSGADAPADNFFEIGSVTSHRRLNPVFFGIEPCRGHGAVGFL
jgi:hypothetical protein